MSAAIPRILILCATERGRLFLERLTTLLPSADLTVCTFKEESWEPPFFESIKDFSRKSGHVFISCRDVAKHDIFAGGDFDLMFAVSWRYLVPHSVFGRIRRGAYVFHDSLLPKYRGFSPTVWAILNGERETGVTLFEMADDVDSGKIVDQMRIEIGPDEYIGAVMMRVTDAYLTLLERHIAGLINGGVPKSLQDESAATYVCKRLPDDSRIDWGQSAARVFDLIRAVSHPYSGAFTFLNGRKMTIWSASRPSDTRCYVGVVPGRICQCIRGQGVSVFAADRPLFIREAQLEGESVVTADQLLDGTSLRLA